MLAVGPLVYITDFFVLVTTKSARQTRAMADALNAAAKEHGFHKGRVEGQYQSPWLLADFGMVVVHVLTDEARGFYALDQLWADAEEIDLEFGAADGSGS